MVYSDYLNRKSLKITSQAKSINIRARILAGNLVGGLVYSQIQNLKTAYNYQTKLRNLIVYEKSEVLGGSFLVGGVPKQRVDKI